MLTSDHHDILARKLSFFLSLDKSAWLAKYFRIRPIFPINTVFLGLNCMLGHDDGRILSLYKHVGKCIFSLHFWTFSSSLNTFPPSLRKWKDFFCVISGFHQFQCSDYSRYNDSSVKWSLLSFCGGLQYQPSTRILLWRSGLNVGSQRHFQCHFRCPTEWNASAVQGYVHLQHSKQFFLQQKKLDAGADYLKVLRNTEIDVTSFGGILT